MLQSWLLSSFTASTDILSHHMQTASVLLLNVQSLGSWTSSQLPPAMTCACSPANRDCQAYPGSICCLFGTPPRPWTSAAHASTHTVSGLSSCVSRYECTPHLRNNGQLASIVFNGFAVVNSYVLKTVERRLPALNYSARGSMCEHQQHIHDWPLETRCEK